jgi:hypothetical protein
MWFIEIASVGGRYATYAVRDSVAQDVSAPTGKSANIFMFYFYLFFISIHYSSPSQLRCWGGVSVLPY